MSGCGGCHADETARIDELELALDELRADLAAVEERDPRTVIVTEPSTDDAPAPDEAPDEEGLVGRLDATRAAMAASDTLLDEVDEDLAALEEDLDEHDEELEILRSDVEKLSAAMQSQSEALAGITDELSLLRSEALAAQELAARFHVEDGAVVLDGGDFILRQGRRKDGMPDGTGRIFTQVDPGQGAAGRRP